MSNQNAFANIKLKIIKYFLAVAENDSKDIGTPKNILVVRQHNQFGDLLASVSLFRAIKETFPDSNLTVIAGIQNFYAISGNKFIDNLFVFDKKKLFAPSYFFNLKRVLNLEYDLAIAPSTVSVSFTSLLLLRLANANIRVGPKSLNGQVNQYAFLFDRRIDINWNKKPDAHVSDFILDIVRPFGISTENFTTDILISASDKKEAENFITSINLKSGEKLIGLHVGAGKPKNRWSLDKYVDLIENLNEKVAANFYLTGTNADNEELEYVKNKLGLNINFFVNKKVSEVAALIEKSDLFITNDTGVMHVAGATLIPQVSIFGPTNPFNWAPLGPNKYFIRKSDLIDDIEVEDVLPLCMQILGNNLDR